MSRYDPCLPVTVLYATRCNTCNILLHATRCNTCNTVWHLGHAATHEWVMSPLWAPMNEGAVSPTSHGCPQKSIDDKQLKDQSVWPWRAQKIQCLFISGHTLSKALDVHAPSLRRRVLTCYFPPFFPLRVTVTRASGGRDRDNPHLRLRSHYELWSQLWHGPVLEQLIN